MKILFYKATAVFMALLVLMTTMSLAVDMHYCGDNLVDFSFLKDAKTCGMEKEQLIIGCKNPEIKKKSCCSDEQLIIKGQDNLKDTSNTFNFEQRIFVAAFAYSYIDLFEGIVSKEVLSVNYSPPLVRRDIQILHQKFLI